MKKIFLLLFVISGLFGCKKDNTSINSTLKKYYFKFTLDGKEKIITENESAAYVYNGRTEGTVGQTGLNSIAIFPSTSFNDFTTESQFTSLLNVKMPINTTQFNETSTSAQFYFLDTQIFDTADNAGGNSFPTNYVKLTKITYVSSEPSAGGTIKYYDVQGEFNCSVKATFSSVTKSITNGTFNLKFGIEII